MKNATRAAALLGLLGVALGAFGAHSLKGTLVAHGTVAIWNTAVLYQLIHAVAALWVAGRRPAIVWIWTAGVVFFSGSLYALALTGFTKLGAITPLGGVLFLAGWVWLILRPD